MAVSDRQLANQTTFNNAFMSRTVDDNTTGKKALNNLDAESGTSVDNIQESINSLSNYTGRPANDPIGSLPTWINNDVGNSSDNLQERSDALTEKFNSSTGHVHTGAAGDAPQISIVDVVDINQYRADWQTVDITSATGTSYNVSLFFSGKTAGGGNFNEGVLTGGSFNRVVIMNPTTETAIEDAGGQRVYGRLTYATSVWTLSFYTNEAGVQTAYNLPTQNIRIYFREVFSLATYPTIPADMGQIPSLDLTADIVDAGPSQRGLTRFAAGEVSLSSGADSVTVTFSSAFPNTNYAVAPVLRNTIDATPQVYAWTMTAKSASGFTLGFNAPMNSANYVFEYTATRYQ